MAFFCFILALLTRLSHQSETLGASRVYLNCLKVSKVIGKTRPYDLYILICRDVNSSIHFITSNTALGESLSLNHTIIAGVSLTLTPAFSKFNRSEIAKIKLSQPARRT